ncbi:hypothetical protein [Microvirga roseola]|uniref:hypothetical protein n=1 Tax=Microvirga roseola TaxID=2883126 RepID=UPI001E30002D|nr:hypothetical protein [Microvirga roseola]
MTSQISHDQSYAAEAAHDGPARAVARSSFCVMPHTPKPARAGSFIFGRSDARMRPLLNQEERDRLHCWAMIVAVASSAAGTALLLTASLY